MRVGPSGGTRVESVDFPGALLACANGALTTSPSAAEVTVAEPLAEYPSVAFWARQGGPGWGLMLLLPLNELVDESYTIYHEMEP